MELDRFEVCETKHGVRVFVNGSEIKAVSDYSVDQSENDKAKITVCFWANAVNINFDKNGSANASNKTSTE